MRRLVISLFLLLVPSAVSAMSVVSDLYPSSGWQPSDFFYQIQVGVDGNNNPVWGTEILAITDSPTGGVRMKIDISAWPAGKTTLRAKARKVILPLTVEESGWSVPFLLQKTDGQKIPSGFGLVE